MLNIKEFFSVLNKFAPIELSYKCIENGSYDNSGILVNCHQEVKKALFCLDLTEKAIETAKKNKCDTVVTHHPAIYSPIKRLDENGENKAVLLAIKNNLNVISMHLNLDVAKLGIDYNLALALGGSKQEILDGMGDELGYGRVFSVNSTLYEIEQSAKKTLNSNKILRYGSKGQMINKIASFCGAGGGYIEELLAKNKIDAELIVSADLPHHVIVKIIESGKSLLVIPHYVSEIYGLNNYYHLINKEICDKIDTQIFIDKRFM